MLRCACLEEIYGTHEVTQESLKVTKVTRRPEFNARGCRRVGTVAKYDGLSGYGH